VRVISSAAIAEKNKIATDSAWIVLLEIQLSGGTLYLAANNEDITWNSQTWQAFPFELDTVAETGKGEIPAITVKVSNVTGEIQQYLEAADGANGTPVIIRVINSSASTSTESELELSFVLDRASYDAQWLTFYLTGANCLSRRVPRGRYLKNFCRFEYGGVECGVSAATQATYPTCNRTKANCEERNNSTRFGGFPFMPEL
jgi:lambda family phage minor tail protein L